MVDRTNHIWRTSNLHCKSSVAWLTVQTIFGEPVIFAVNPPWRGWWHKAILWVQHIAMMFFVVCGEPNTIMWYFLKSIVFTCYLSCMVYRTDFLLVWGSLRLAPITLEFIYKSLGLVIYYCKCASGIPNLFTESHNHRNFIFHYSIVGNLS